MLETQAHILPPDSDGSCGPLLYSKVSVYGAVFLCLNFILLLYLFVFDKGHFSYLTQEDYWVENSTAFLLFLTALLLLATAVRARGAPGSWLYLLGALAFVFGAGEEISWGQRLLEFETPAHLLAINTQDEFNLHNIEGINVNGMYRIGVMSLCIVTAAACFARKSSLFGVPLPSILLLFCFFVTLAWWPKDYVGGSPLSVFEQQNLLLLLFAVWACFFRQGHVFILSALFLAVVVFEQSVLHIFGGRPVPNSVWEPREYLFSIVSVLYAGELYSHAQKPRPAGRIANVPTWLLVLSLIVLGVWLVVEVSDSLVDGVRDGRLRNRIVDRLESGTLEPVRRADFDIYLALNRLIYVKEQCAPEDVDLRFFVHIVPADPADLPRHRKRYGFDNLDFYFHEYELSIDGRCVAIRNLPDYDSTAIRTGQWNPWEKRRVWSVEFDISEAANLEAEYQFQW